MTIIEKKYLEPACKIIKFMPRAVLCYSNDELNGTEKLGGEGEGEDL